MRARRRLIHAGLAAGSMVLGVPGIVAAADGGPIDSGDTAWMLIATALVMVMLPGLALFYGGLVRRKNVLSTIMHSFFGLALVSVVWVVVGFSLAFGKDVGGFGLDRRPSTSSASSTWASPPMRPTDRRSRSSCSPPSS